MSRLPNVYVLLLCVVLTVLTAFVHYTHPEAATGGAGLLLAVLLTVFSKGSRVTLVFAIAALALTAAGFFYPGSHWTHAHFYRLQAFFAGMLVVACLLVLYLKKRYASRESHEMQVKALFEYATEGIILTDQKGRIVLANPAALRLFKYERGQLLDKSIDTLIPGRFQAAHVQYRKGFYQQPSNRKMGHGRHLFARSSDDREFPVEVSLSYYQQNKAFFVIAFIVDITERKRAEQELLAQKAQLEKITLDVRKLNADLETKVEQRTLILKEALQELERSQKELSEALSKEKELNEIKSRFVAMASHEFRTPLSTVLSSASLIGKYVDTASQDQRDKHIRRIKDSVKHLNNLLEDFLSLGKLEEGHLKIVAGDIPLKEFISEVVDELQTGLTTGQVILPVLEGDNFFSTDQRLLKHILLNLLGNAVKFSGAHQTIWLQVNQQGGRLTITVQDEGVGIPEEDMQRLFSTFFRGKNVVNIEGTGLGLHIVKRYVELLGGNIFLSSRLNRGTAVTVQLPALHQLAGD